MRRAVLALLLALSLPPAALAAAGHETEARLRLEAGAAVRGVVDLRGEGLLEFEPERGEVPLQVGFGRVVEGELVHRWRDKVHLGLPGADGPSATEPEWETRPLAAVGAGRVENVRCGPRCLVALHNLPGEGLVGAGGRLEDAPEPTPGPRDVHTSTPGQGAAGSQFRYVLPAGTLETLGESPAMRPHATGRVALVLADATFDLVDEEGRRSVDARSGNETTREAAGQQVTTRHHARHAVLVLDAPALDLAPGGAFRLSHPDGADARLEGTLSARAASGDLRVAGARHALDRAALLLEGSMAGSLRAADSDASGARPVLAQMQGRATRVAVDGVDLTPALPSGRAATVGAGALALVAAALLGRSVLLPLYHRLGPMDVLANENRRRIYEAVRARPGVSVAELVAAVGLARVLVRHHLRMLEAHKLVRATSWRRRRTYAAVGEGAGQAAAELKDATRRRVAAAVVRAGRATQKDLVAALGLSQRLVSYHLRRLEAASLVGVEGRNPRSYVATEALAQAVEREEKGAAATGTAAPDGLS